MRRLAALLALSLQASPAMACRCDFGPLRELQKDPSKASAAFVAIAEDGPAGRRLRVDRSWTLGPRHFPFEKKSTCALSLEAGKRYLVFSIHDAGFIEKRGLGFTICDTAAVELASAQNEIDALAGRSVPLGSSPSWFYCARSSDCEPAEDVCGHPTAVNRKHRAPHAAWVRETAPDVGCASPPEAGRQPSVACLDHFCAVDAHRRPQAKPRPP